MRFASLAPGGYVDRLWYYFLHSGFFRIGYSSIVNVAQCFFVKEFMRLFIILILVAFPTAEICLLLELGEHYGWWLILYLVVITYLGFQLIKGEKQMMTTKMMQSIQAGGNPFKTIMGSARNLIAGFLLVIPGVITDVIAVALLLIPMQQASDPSDSSEAEGGYRRTDSQSANDDIIEGEFEEIKEKTKYENISLTDQGPSQ